MIKLLMIDDHALVRNAIRMFLSQSDEFDTIDEAANEEQMFTCLQQKTYDLLLLDMNMPGMDGPEMIVEARKLQPDTPILVLSADDTPQSARRAIRAGAVGYLTKNSDPDMLLSAVRQVAAGGRSMDPVLAQKIAFEEAAPLSTTPHQKLSERELQILALLAAGNSVTEIADMLFISHKTVSTHKARLMEKMGFGSNAELVRYALTHQLVK